MRYFYDTEFVERGREAPIELVSIGVVAEDGRTYLAANAAFTPASAPVWVRDHVVPHLPPRSGAAWKPPAAIAAELREFVGPEPPVLWGRWSAYDHVVLAGLFGDMSGWPPGWPMYTRDLEQVRQALDVPPEVLPPRGGSEHDALADAHHAAAVYDYLRQRAREAALDALGSSVSGVAARGAADRIAGLILP